MKVLAIRLHRLASRSFERQRYRHGDACSDILERWLSKDGEILQLLDILRTKSKYDKALPTRKNLSWKRRLFVNPPNASDER